MKKLTIRNLPIINLSRDFSVQDENGRIKHYTASDIYSLSAGLDGVNATDPVELLKTQLKNEHGDDVFFDFCPETPVYRQPLPIDIDIFTGDAFDACLKMEAIKSPRILYESITPLPFFERISNKIYNFFVTKFNEVNNFLYKMKNKMKIRKMIRNAKALDLSEEEVQDLETGFVFGVGFNFVELKEIVGTRDFHPVTYFGIRCGEDDLYRALTELSNDLDVLGQNDLVLAHFMMPSVMELPNPIGNGKKIFAVFAMPVLDSNKMSKIDPSSLKWVCQEGELRDLDGKAPYSDLVDGPVINLFDEVKKSDQEAINQAYLEGKKAQKEFDSKKNKG
jgi:hypothetical protein